MVQESTLLDVLGGLGRISSLKLSKVDSPLHKHCVVMVWPQGGCGLNSWFRSKG